MPDIFGTEAAETLNGTSANDRIYGLGGNDKLYGKNGNDELYGGAGNDTVNGNAGADIMFGGSGDDTYYVDNVGDVVSEETVAGVDDGGNDRVYSTISYTLGAFFEKLTLTGSAAIDATGNAQANTLIGNDATNVLTGGLGKDTLTGGAGADTFMFGPADATSTDNVLDFAAADRVGINASDYGLSLGNGLVLDGSGTLVLDPAYFATVSGSSTVQGTASGHGQFVFNTTTLKLMWDADGAGPECRCHARHVQLGHNLKRRILRHHGDAGGRRHLDRRRHDHRGQQRHQDGDLHGEPHRDRGVRRRLCHRRRHGGGWLRLRRDRGHA